jgi:hypothetical protein
VLELKLVLVLALRSVSVWDHRLGRVLVLASALALAPLWEMVLGLELAHLLVMVWVLELVPPSVCESVQKMAYLLLAAKWSVPLLV